MAERSLEQGTWPAEGTSLDEHMDILAAIRDEDPDAARERMTAHMDGASARLVASLESGELRRARDLP